MATMLEQPLDSRIWQSAQLFSFMHGSVGSPQTLLLLLLLVVVPLDACESSSVMLEVVALPSQANFSGQLSCCIMEGHPEVTNARHSAQFSSFMHGSLDKPHTSASSSSSFSTSPQVNCSGQRSCTRIVRQPPSSRDRHLVHRLSVMQGSVGSPQAVPRSPLVPSPWHSDARTRLQTRIVG